MISIKQEDNIKEILASWGCKELNILITQVDPDAIGSAITLKHLVDYISADISIILKIFYCGAVSHPQNRVIFNTFNLKSIMRPIAEMRSNDIEEENIIALVDSSSITDVRLPKEMMGKIKPLIIVDHHRGGDYKAGGFHWVDEEAGSTCTLMTELLKRYKYPLKENPTLANLLAIGIYTDTKSLIGGGDRDRQAYGYLSSFIAPETINKMIYYQLPQSYFDHLKIALQLVQYSNERAVTGVGIINAEDGDDISSVADYFIRRFGTDLVVVWGIIGDMVRISARSSNLSIPLDDFLFKRFGNRSGAKMMPNGQAEGGANLVLDLGFWLSEHTKSKAIEIVQQTIEEKVFKD